MRFAKAVSGFWIRTRRRLRPILAVLSLRVCPVRVVTSRVAFSPNDQAVSFDANRSMRLGTTLQVGAISESVTVTASASTRERDSRRIEELAKKINEDKQAVPSQNVANFQRRIAESLFLFK